jgi:bilin biosynthesis protein
MRIFLLCILLAPLGYAGEMNPKPGDADLCTPSWLNATSYERTLDVPALIEHLRSDPNKNARILAARSLGRIGDRRAEPALIAALRSPDKHVRTEAAWALGHFSSAGETALLNATNDASPHVRMAAACSLGKIGTSTARPALQRLAIDDPDALVAAAARWSVVSERRRAERRQ